MKYKNIVVTGGSGMVGKSLSRILKNGIFLSSKDYDLTLDSDVNKMFCDLKPDVIIHLAAKVGGIIDNINKPYDYFSENVLMNTLLLEHSRINNVKRFIGILSTCIYPDVVSRYPMTEDMLHIGPPTRTNFSYGYAKRCLAVQIDACNKQYGTKYQYLIPSNLYGENDKFGDNSHFVAALLEKVFDLIKNNKKTLKLYGTGSPMRQFMHSDDLAWVIYKCLEEEIYESFNVSTEENLSIKEIATILLDIANLNDVELIFDDKKPDGQYRKDVSISKLKEYIPNFTPLKLKEGLKIVYDKISERYY
jgi:GDP-L-fucose synthase